MVGKLKRLSGTTQDALKQLACLGNVVEIATLTLVHGESEEEIHTALWEATRTGLILRQESSYAFLHDRIQEAAYALIPAANDRAEAHLRVGRALLANMTADGLGRPSVRCREPAQSRRRDCWSIATRKRRLRPSTCAPDERPRRRRPMPRRARIFRGHGAVRRKGLEQPLRVKVQPVARMRGVRVPDR